MTISLDSIKMTSGKHNFKPRIVIIGVGGAGGNAVNNMVRAKLQSVEFFAINTDAQALECSIADHTIQIGTNITQGLGAGAKPEVGKKAAEESREEIENILKGANMLFITAGMGGGTGTGAAPIIAEVAKSMDILTVGIVTKPFDFEGRNRQLIAENGIKEFSKHVDTLIVIPNQNLFRVANENTSFVDAFKMADDVLCNGVKSITDLITIPGLVNLDFADLKTIMKNMGKAMISSGRAQGEDRAVNAASAAIINPLLDTSSINGAGGVVISIVGGFDMTLFEVNDAVSVVRENLGDEAEIIFGAAFKEECEGSIVVSVIATGIDQEKADSSSSEGISKRKAVIKTQETEQSKPAYQMQTNKYEQLEEGEYDGEQEESEAEDDYDMDSENESEDEQEDYEFSGDEGEDFEEESGDFDTDESVKTKQKNTFDETMFSNDDLFDGYVMGNISDLPRDTMIAKINKDNGISPISEKNDRGQSEAVKHDRPIVKNEYRDEDFEKKIKKPRLSFSSAINTILFGSEDEASKKKIKNEYPEASSDMLFSVNDFNLAEKFKRRK